MRGSQSKWNHVLSRTFLRPRDVIKFLNVALSVEKNRIRSFVAALVDKTEPQLTRIENEDITYARDEYSRYLKAELDDEIIAHWPQ